MASPSSYRVAWSWTSALDGHLRRSGCSSWTSRSREVLLGVATEWRGGMSSAPLCAAKCRDWPGVAKALSEESCSEDGLWVRC